MGIGTSSPATGVHSLNASTHSKIQVETSASGGLSASFIATSVDGRSETRYKTNAGNYWNTGVDSDGAYKITNNANGNMSSNQRLVIDSTGNVGIGTSSPASALHIARSGGGASLTLQRTDANTTGGVGVLQYTASDGHILAAVNAEGDGNNEGAHLVFRTTGNATGTNYYTDTTERMRISSAGDVGIGTTDLSADEFSATPAGVIKLAGNKPVVYLDEEDTTNSNVWLGLSSGVGILGNTGTALAFRTGAAAATERMRIDSSGNVLVGATSTAYTEKLSIGMTTANQGLAIKQTDNANANDKILFINTNGIVGYIRTTGSSTAYATSSDYRLKELDVPMTGATERVKALRPINFAWKADGSRVDGFFAHELAEVVPEAATGTKDAMMDEEYEVTPAVVDAEGVETTAAVMGTRSVPDYQGIDQSKLVPLLTATIQELIARIEILESGV